MFFIRKIASDLFLKVFLLIGRKVFLFIFFGLVLLGSVVYITYPYVQISCREKNTSKYLKAIESLYKKKDKTREDLINEVKKQTSTNKLLLLTKLLPEFSLSKKDEVKIMEKFANLTSAAPVVYDFFILKLSDILIEKNDSSCLKYLKKISSDHPYYEIAQKKIIKFFLIQKNFKKAQEKISSLEKKNFNVTELKEMLFFLKKTETK